MTGTERGAEIGDSGLGREALVDQFQQPDAPGIGVAMLFRTQQEAEGGFGIDPHQDGIAPLEDLIEEVDDDGGEVVLLVDSQGLSNGAVQDVVHGTQGDQKIEDVAKQFDHAAGGAMADEHQGEDQLPQPSLGNRQVEEDLLGSQNGGEGTVEQLLRGVQLLVEELPADLVLAGQLGDCFRPGEHLDGQVSPLLKAQTAWPDKKHEQLPELASEAES